MVLDKESRVKCDRAALDVSALSRQGRVAGAAARGRGALSLVDASGC